jgi:hypothetical protein
LFFQKTDGIIAHNMRSPESGPNTPSKSPESRGEQPPQETIGPRLLHVINEYEVTKNPSDLLVATFMAYDAIAAATSQEEINSTATEIGGVLFQAENVSPVGRMGRAAVGTSLINGLATILHNERKGREASPPPESPKA